MSLASAIFSESQIRLFEWLFGQPDRIFHLSELRRLSGLGSASVQRELQRLTKAGLVLSDRVGNLRRFQANPDSPVYAELVSLVRKSLGIVPALRDALLPIANRLQTAFIYGSVAKQTDTAASDVDVLLVGEDLSLNEVLELFLPVESRLGRKVNPNCYTPSEYARRCAEKDSFVQRILAQPILSLI